MQHEYSRYLESLEQRALVFDGAMGTNIQSYDLSLDDYGGKEGCNENLVMVRPQVIEEIHRGFLEAGCDVLETDTFGGNRLKMEEYGLGDQSYEVNYTAAQLARRLADEYSTPGRPRFVAGSMGPTGKLPSADDPVLSNISFDQLSNIYYEQARPLVEGGCDLLLIETSQDMLEVRAAIIGINRYFRDSGRWVPIQAQVTLDTAGRMLLGTDIGAALTTIASLPVQIVGLNCSTGPEHMREPVRYLAENSPLKISVIPNAGLPLNVGGRAVYPLEPDAMAHLLAEFVEEMGVEVVGGCCGTTHDHGTSTTGMPYWRRPAALRHSKGTRSEAVAPPALRCCSRGCSSMVEPQPSKLAMPVRSRSPAPLPGQVGCPSAQLSAALAPLPCLRGADPC